MIRRGLFSIVLPSGASINGGLPPNKAEATFNLAPSLVASFI